MKKINKSLTSIKQVGFSTLAAGAILIAGGNAASADEGKEFGESLMFEGKSSENVAELNDLLADMDLLDAKADNTYTTATTDAVATFQKENGLLVDGLAGVQTAGALSELSVGDTGYLVEELQKDLNAKGLYDYEIDGIFGPITEKGVKQFQAKNDLEQTGVAGADTYAALYYSGSATTAPAEETAEAASEEPVEEEPVEEEPAEEPVEEEPVEEEPAEEPAEEEPAEEEAVQTQEAPADEPDGDTINMEATAYTAFCTGCSGVTATGIDLRSNPNQLVVAVDPNVIPLGSIVEVEGYGRAVAGDTGGAIRGNRIDLFMPERSDAVNFGRQNIEVTVVETP